MAGRYAEDTNVTPLQTLDEIKRTLARFGATTFGYWEDSTSTVVTFQVENLRVALKMDHPDRKQFEKNSYGNKRKPHVVDQDHQQAIRSRWRVLHLAIKAICTGRDLHEWTDESGNGRIRAPSLKGCQCFWCGADLVPHPSTVPQQVALI